MMSRPLHTLSRGLYVALALTMTGLPGLASAQTASPATQPPSDHNAKTATPIHHVRATHHHHRKSATARTRDRLKYHKKAAKGANVPAPS